MNRNKQILIEVIDNLLENDPMYSGDKDMQDEIKNHVLTCIEGVSNSAWVSARRSSDLVRQICQSYISLLDNPPSKRKKKSKFS
jgi:hypothetical protein